MKKPKKKQVKKELTIRQDIRHLGVLIERVDDDVKLVAEQYGDIKKDTAGIKKTVDSHTETIDKIVINLAVTKEDVKSIKGTLDSHTEMIGNLAVGLGVVKTDLEIVKADVKTTKVDIEIVKTDIEFIKNSLKKKVDVEEFAALERRVALLERRR